MHFTKRRAVVSLVFLGLLAFSWSIWAHFVKIEHDIDRMITDIGRGGQSGFFLFGSLDRVSIEEAKVSIRTIVLACGAQYLPLLVDYMPWSVVDENENVFCGIPVTPVVVYSVMEKRILAYHDPKSMWRLMVDDTSALVPFETTFDAEFKIENAFTRKGPTQLVPDPTYRYPYDSYIVAPVIALYDNSTNMPLPLLSYTVINTANSFVAEPWPFIINDCISDPPTNLRCADTYIWLKRTYITKSIAILSLVVGWLLALMTVVLAVIAWRGPSKESSEDQTKRTRPGRRISENVLLFPIATTLAIPALRSLFPAAPPTGILFDHVGIYPQLLLIFGCGIFLSWVVIYRRLKGRTEKVSTGDAARDSTHHPDTVHFGLHERDGVDETEHESAKGAVSPDK